MAFVGMDGKLSRKENKCVLGAFWRVAWLFELCLDVKDVFFDRFLFTGSSL